MLNGNYRRENNIETTFEYRASLLPSSIYMLIMQQAQQQRRTDCTVTIRFIDDAIFFSARLISRPVIINCVRR